MVQVGTLVHLLSGSPRMTVTATYAGMLEVTWIHYNSGEVKTLRAPAGAFKMAEPPLRGPRHPDPDYDGTKYWEQD